MAERDTAAAHAALAALGNDLFGDNATCTRIENKMAAESLTGDFAAFVVMLGSWFPELEFPVNLVVIDAATLAGLPGPRRLELMAKLQDVTVPGGVHAVLPHEDSVAETWVSLYPDWDRERLRSETIRRGAKRPSSPGVLLTRPLLKSTQQVSSA